MKIRSLKKPILILSVVILSAVILWPLPAQFKYVGSQFITFSLALYVGLRIWRTSQRGQWVMNFQRSHKYCWLVYIILLCMSCALTYLTVATLGYWPRVLIEFILVVGIIYYVLREFKRFLI